MEGTNNNRMLLAIRSGILPEIGWALDRLCRLAQNDQFFIHVYRRAERDEHFPERLQGAMLYET